MDRECRWWIVDEITRWWRTASLEARYVLMQRALEGTPEATIEEVRQGACLAEIDCDEGALREALAQQTLSRQWLEAWTTGQGQRRR